MILTGLANRYLCFGNSLSFFQSGTSSAPCTDRGQIQGLNGRDEPVKSFIYLVSKARFWRV